MEHDRTGHHPPGEPPAEALAEQLADVVVVDGPHAGEVWTYDGARGGYVRASGAGQLADETVCDDIGALLVHLGAQVVRPLPADVDPVVVDDEAERS